MIETKHLLKYMERDYTNIPIDMTQAKFEQYIKSNQKRINSLSLVGCVNITCIPDTYKIERITCVLCPVLTSINCGPHVRYLYVNKCPGITHIPDIGIPSVRVCECPGITSITLSVPVKELVCENCDVTQVTGPIDELVIIDCRLIKSVTCINTNSLKCNRCESLCSISGVSIMYLSCKKCPSLKIENIGYMPNIRRTYTNVKIFKKLNRMHYELAVNKELGAVLNVCGAGGFTEDFTNTLLEF